MGSCGATFNLVLVDEGALSASFWSIQQVGWQIVLNGPFSIDFQARYGPFSTIDSRTCKTGHLEGGHDPFRPVRMNSPRAPGPLIVDRPARLAPVLPPHLAYFGFLAPNLQIFQGNSAANCSFSRIRGCLQPSGQS